MLTGPRLCLRPFRAEDAPALAALNADPRVMRHFPAPLTRAESDTFLFRITAHHRSRGYSLWAVEDRWRGDFIGLCGLLDVAFAAEFTPAVEIGWRLHPAFWGQGLAREAAERVLAHAFGPLGIPEVVAFTVPTNVASWRLMERLGMRPDGAFEHPRLPWGHPLRRHLLYRLRRDAPAR